MIRTLGKRHLGLAKAWAPTAATYGTGSLFALLFFTDWQVVCRYIPIYGSKFKDEETK